MAQGRNVSAPGQGQEGVNLAFGCGEGPVLGTA